MCDGEIRKLTHRQKNGIVNTEQDRWSLPQSRKAAGEESPGFTGQGAR